MGVCLMEQLMACGFSGVPVMAASTWFEWILQPASWSVILQVASFRLRKKRIFKMAPLHHHFEMLGWSEEKVVTRFWIIGIILSLLSLGTLKVQ